MRARVLPSQTVSAGTATQVVDARTLELVGFQAITSSFGSATGVSLKIQQTNEGPDSTNWDDIADATINITANGSVTVEADAIAARWVRGYISIDSGTPTVTVIASGKAARVR